MMDVTGLFILLAFALVLVVALLCWMLSYGLTHPPRLTAGAAAARSWWMDPGDAGLEFSEWSLDRPGGVRLPVWDIHNPDCLEGPTIIITHNWGGSKISSLQRAPFVFASASRIIMWDMRGHGEAEGESRTRLGAVEVDDLLDLVDRVASSHSPVILFGLSMGGGISIAAAAREPRVIGVATDGPYRWAGEPVRCLLKHHRLPDWPIRHIVHRYLCLRVPGMKKFDRGKLAARLQCPLLVMHGTHDQVCPLESAQEIVESAPRGTLVIFEDSTHLELHVDDAELYRKSLEDFIDTCMESPSPDAASAASVTAGEAKPSTTTSISTTTLSTHSANPISAAPRIQTSIESGSASGASSKSADNPGPFMNPPSPAPRPSSAG